MLKVKKIRAYLESKSSLDLFLIKGALLVSIYYLLRFILRFVPFFRPVFVFARNLMINFLLNSSYFVLKILGYNAGTEKNILYISGSPGVKIINACIGWSTMAMFVGFIIIYGGNKKARYWFVPLGLAIIVLFNILRIALMAIIYWRSPGSLHFYHYYVFNFVLLVVVFALWGVWIKFYKTNKQ